MSQASSGALGALLVLLGLAACDETAGLVGTAADAGAQPLLDANTVQAAAGRVKSITVSGPKISINPEVPAECSAICDRSNHLKCKRASDCMKNCLAMTTTPCAEPTISLYHCLITQSLEHWECGEDGVAAIREGYCDKEQAGVFACMQAKMTR